METAQKYRKPLRAFENTGRGLQETGKPEEALPHFLRRHRNLSGHPRSGPHHQRLLRQSPL